MLVFAGHPFAQYSNSETGSERKKNGSEIPPGFVTIHLGANILLLSPQLFAAAFIAYAAANDSKGVPQLGEELTCQSNQPAN